MHHGIKSLGYSLAKLSTKKHASREDGFLICVNLLDPVTHHLLHGIQNDVRKSRISD
jgi:hypothetical protein